MQITRETVKRGVVRLAKWTGIVLGALVLTAAVGLGALIVYLNHDASVAARAAQLFNANFVGHAQLGGAHLEFPAGVTLTDVRIDGRDGTPQLIAHRVHVRLALLPLLRQRVVVSAVQVDDGSVQLVATGEGPFALIDALTPSSPDKTQQPSDQSNADSWQIELTDATFNNIIVNLHTDALQLIVQGATLQAHAEVDRDAAHVGFKLHVSSLYLAMPGSAPLSFHDAAVHVSQGTYVLATGAVQLGESNMHLQDTDLDLRGTFSGLASVLPSVHATAQLRFNTATTPLLKLLPAPLLNTLHPAGAAQLTAFIESKNDGLTLDAELQGTQLQVADANIETVRLGGHFDGSTLTLDRFYGKVLGGVVAGDGHLTVLPTLGEHAVTLSIENIAPQQALAPWLASTPQVSGMLPSTLRLAASAAGPSLAPLQTHIRLHAQAAGFAADALPGLPDPLSLTAEADLSDDALQIGVLSAEGDDATVTIHGTVPLQTDGAVNATVTMRHNTPQRTLQRLGVTATAARVQAEAQITGTLARPQGDATMRIDGLAVAAVPPTRVSAHVALHNGVLRLDKGEIRNAAGSLTVSGALGLLDKNGVVRPDPSLQAAVTLPHYALDALLPDLLAGDAHASVQLKGTVQRPTGEVELGIERLAIHDVVFTQAQAHAQLQRGDVVLTALHVTPQMGGTLSGGGHYNIQGKTLDAHVMLRDLPAIFLEDLEGKTFGLDGTFSADVNARGPAATPTFEAAVHGTDLTLQSNTLGSLEINAEGTAQTARARVSLTGGVANLTADARATLATRQIEATLNAPALALRHLLQMAQVELPMDGTLGVNARATGDWQRPQVSATVGLSDWQLDGKPMGNGQANVSLRTQKPGVYAAQLQVAGLLTGDAQATTWPQTSLVAHVHFEKLAASAFVPQSVRQGADVVLSGSSTLNYDGATEHIEGSLDIAQLQAQANNQTLTLTRPAHIVLHDNAVTLGTLSLQGAPGSLTVRGHVGDTLDCRAVGNLDLAFVASLVPQLGQASGGLQFDVSAQGPLKALQTQGKVALTRPATLRLRSMPEEIHVTRLALHMDSQALTIDDLAGTFGAGAITARGDIALRNFRPVKYRVHLQGDALPVHTQDLVLEANVGLDLLGEEMLPLIKARIDITRGRYFKKFALQDFNFVAREPDVGEPLDKSMPWLKDLQLDITATSSAGVDIQVDAGAFAVQASLQPDLHVTGTPLAPHIDGKVAADSGLIRFPKADLALTQAVIDFVPRPSGKLDAELSLHAAGDVTPTAASGGTASSTYAVTLALEGTLDKMQLDLQSNPALGRLEILALLTTGHVSFADLTASGGQDSNKLDAALAFAGSQVSAPLARFAEQLLEKRLNIHVQLGAEFDGQQVRVTAAKELNRRLRIEGSYSHAIAQQQASVTTRANLILTDRLRLEGGTEADLSGTTSSAASDSSLQSSLELKLRLIGH